MAAKIKANVEEAPNNNWIIRLIDEELNKEIICDDMNQFKEKISDIGEPYSGDIEVLWSKNDDVTDAHFYELHQEMAKLKEELEE